MKADRDRWDRRYARERQVAFDPDPFLVEHRDLLSGGCALDLACGRGANALFLAEQGYRVTAVDISGEAITALKAEARSRGLDVACIVADLDEFPLPVERYDLIIVFYFFDPRLVSSIINSLKPDGLLFYATFNIRHLSLRPEFNPAYLVKPEDLGRLFSDLSLLLQEPEVGDTGNVSRIIARKS